MTMQSPTVECAAVKPTNASRHVAAKVAPKNVSDLIEAHRIAHAAHIVACDKLTAAEEAHSEARRKASPRLVSNLMGTHYEITLLPLHECTNDISRRCAEARNSARRVACIAPDNLARTLADIDAKEAEALDHIAKAYDDFENELQVASGEDIADMLCGEAARAASAATDALCAVPCATLAEAQMKAAYLLAQEDGVLEVSADYLPLILKSLLSAQA